MWQSRNAFFIISILVGLEYWKQLANEHRINPDGTLQLEDQPQAKSAPFSLSSIADRKDIFFYQVFFIS